jgi:hypothetical protein
MICIVTREVSAIVAVLGRLVGSSLTYAFQRRSAEQAQAHAFGTLLRAEHLTAYSGLASALMDWRRGQAGDTALRALVRIGSKRWPPTRQRIVAASLVTIRERMRTKPSTEPED